VLPARFLHGRARRVPAGCFSANFQFLVFSK